MKKIFCIAAIFLFTFCLCGCEEKEKYPTPTEQFYVNDFADVMTDEEESQFLSKAVALNNATTAQVVITTVDNLGGDAPYEYATELGRKWGIGDKEQDNGILILLACDDREIFIAVGYGLEGALPDSKTGRIIDVHGLSYLKNDEFGKGLSAIGSAVINEVYIEYGLEPEAGYVNIENVVPQGEDVETGKVAISWVVLLILLILISFLNRRRGGAFFFLGSGTGFSSGRGSGKGGFGGFSGGGGSFGGGGAGRGF